MNNKYRAKYTNSLPSFHLSNSSRLENYRVTLKRQQNHKKELARPTIKATIKKIKLAVSK